eukprot:4912083-Pleurochrysis_carterae.AAC.1
MVSARSVAPARLACLEPRRRIYSANSVRVSVLYSTPPSSSGSTNGTRSVSATKSLFQPSAVSVLRASVASSSRVRNDARSAAMHAAARSVGSPSRQRSIGLGPREPASPIASARSASARAARTLRLRRRSHLRRRRPGNLPRPRRLSPCLRGAPVRLPRSGGCSSPRAGPHHLSVVVAVHPPVCACVPVLAPSFRTASTHARPAGGWGRGMGGDSRLALSL